jgi:dGTPase
MKLDKKRLNKFRKRLERDPNIGKRGTHNAEASRYFPEKDKKEYKDIRPPFFRDVDRIVHSKAYARYIGKSQVFFNLDVYNSNLTFRALHVILVSRIARHIGRILKLNTDLIEAIALGHDIGHPPFGHLGEEILTEISKKYELGRFFHNAQGIRWLSHLEKRFPEKPARGLNLTLQVLDGILCHNGEIDRRLLKPKKGRGKTWKDHLREYEDSLNDNKIERIPMSYEGVVVRFADVIAYIGRDIEDAILLKYIKRSDIPKHPKKVLGSSNRQIINTLITDLLSNSVKNYMVGYSIPIFNALKELKRFNYENIYIKRDLEFKDIVTKKFYLIFEKSLQSLQKEEINMPIFQDHIEYIDDDEYSTYYKPLRGEGKLPLIVRDYISGMSDKYFNYIYKLLSNQ